jgi:DNA-binding SARP family transcriptional activator
MLRVSLLGEQVIVDEATGAVRSGSLRSVELIAFLVVHVRAPQSRQHIAGLFWPEFSGAQALTNLRRELRQVLGDELSLVVTSRDLTWRDTLNAGSTSASSPCTAQRRWLQMSTRSSS